MCVTRDVTNYAGTRTHRALFFIYFISQILCVSIQLSKKTEFINQKFTLASSTFHSITIKT